MEEIVAVLDACVLFPAALRDTLFYAAEAELYQMRWSWMILAELSRNLIRQKKTTEAQAQRLLQTIQEAFVDAMILEDYMTILESMTNDPKDRHVLAATVATGASVIVTFNIKDFPESSTKPFGIEVQTPDQFLCRLWERNLNEIRGVIATQANMLRRPPKTFDEVLGSLIQHAPEFVRRMKS